MKETSEINEKCRKKGVFKRRKNTERKRNNISWRKWKKENVISNQQAEKMEKNKRNTD